MRRITKTHHRNGLALPALFTRDRIAAVLRMYLRLWHDLEVEGLDRLPSSGPALMLFNHASYLDTPALMAINPYPDSTGLAVASLLRKPILGRALRAWDAIPVERKGKDSGSVAAMLTALHQGRVVGVAVEGIRSRNGRLQRVHPVLAAFAASAEVPIIPVGIAGSFDALPTGALIPRRRKILVRIGDSFLLPPRIRYDEAARRIRYSIAVLLPPDQQPLPADWETGP